MVWHFGCVERVLSSLLKVQSRRPKHLSRRPTYDLLTLQICLYTNKMRYHLRKSGCKMRACNPLCVGYVALSLIHIAEYCFVRCYNGSICMYLWRPRCNVLFCLWNISRVLISIMLSTELQLSYIVWKVSTSYRSLRSNIQFLSFILDARIIWCNVY